ncbi:MAG: 2-phospho-L-lactate guanylyltransferase [Pseudomonadales bacterium]|nr:2-phospho-L-lactate guanylyltransferase [Pseudomonadales bacterium]
MTQINQTGIWAVVPLKSLDRAKQRLAARLNDEERRDLMLAMARDVLGALCQSTRLAGILIVSRTTEADALARAFATERFTESPTADLPGALTQASAHLREHFGASGVMIVPADMPLLDASEIDAVLDQHRQVTVIPDAENVGTNALVLSPPDAIDFIFDGRSFRPHVDAAFARGITPRIAKPASFTLDIDTEADLLSLLEQGPNSQAGTYLIRSGIAERLTGSRVGTSRRKTLSDADTRRVQ